MINTDLLKEYFPDVLVYDYYIFVEKNIVDVISFLKTKNYVDFDVLSQIIAADCTDFVQLTYRLYSTENNEFLNVVTKVKDEAASVTHLYKSAHFDECEIHDLFGINFVGNEKLERLYMPEDWDGHPLLKSYDQTDERLEWNNDQSL
ncbi:NADH-quinone oxidoreductase subunit C [bacterium]|nr:NADH-quinone oxidoreductase subunit C [bacterium]